MTPDPATRARRIVETWIREYNLPLVPLVPYAQTLIAAIDAALLAESAALAEARRDTMTDARRATYDALCRFFSAVTDDMTESGEVDTYDLWESAEKAGLAERVPYDEEKHGDMESVDDGDSVWQLTALGNRATGRANDLPRGEAGTK